MAANVNIVFMGSPDFALPALQQIAVTYTVTGVVTQPDRPAGRGRILTPPPVKSLANSLRIPTIQPVKLRDPGVFEQLQAWRPDLIVVAAFGQILRQNVLSLPRFGCINVHASLLPRWRGASPIQAAILAGDEKTGVTIMQMEAGLDTGPILAQKEIIIEPYDTAGSLSRRLSEIGAVLLLDTLPRLIKGEINAVPQSESGSTYAPLITKEQGALDFQKPVDELVRLIRAFNPWPGAFFEWQGLLLKVIEASVQPGAPLPSEKNIINGFPAVGASGGWLILKTVQPAGKKAMSGQEFLRGARRWQE